MLFRARRFFNTLFDSSDSYRDPKSDIERLASKFREGIARAIGVPPEYISEEKVRKWVENYVKAFVRPEYWSEVLGSPGEYEMEWLGHELGTIIKEASEKQNM